MDFLALSLRMAASDQGAVYAPVVYEGLGEEEEAALIPVFASHVPSAVDSMFNHWYVTKMRYGGFFVRRATWEQGWFADTVLEVVEKVTQYYTR